MNAMTTTSNLAVNTVYNTAFGDRNTLNNLVDYLKSLSKYDPEIAKSQY
jgi:UDP-N-acetylglucosamine 4-epimerase